jgi:hypothetical protein
MFARKVSLWALLGLLPAVLSGPASAQDANLCLDTADRIKSGDKLDESEKQAAHEACLRALAASSNVVQKYHLQEADFDITDTRPKE